MSVNKVILIGHLGKDPELRYMPNGEAVANVSLATSENWKEKDGTKKEKTEWHYLVFYRRLAEIAGEYLKKGAPIYIEGKIQTRKWQDKVSGQDRYTTEIIVNDMKMLGGKHNEESHPTAGHASMDSKPTGETYTSGGLRQDAPKDKPYPPFTADFPDNIPF